MSEVIGILELAWIRCPSCCRRMRGFKCDGWYASRGPAGPDGMDMVDAATGKVLRGTSDVENANRHLELVLGNGVGRAWAEVLLRARITEHNFAVRSRLASAVLEHGLWCLLRGSSGCVLGFEEGLAAVPGPIWDGGLRRAVGEREEPGRCAVEDDQPPPAGGAAVGGDCGRPTRPLQRPPVRPDSGPRGAAAVGPPPARARRRCPASGAGEGGRRARRPGQPGGRCRAAPFRRAAR
jgi:hypothetical protein